MTNAEQAVPIRRQPQSPPRVDAVVRPLLAWFVRNARDLPWRRTLDPYAIWISEIMLQQTQVKTVIPYWERWMHAFPDVQSLAIAAQDRVLKLWEGLGYYTRARNLQKAAKTIVSEHSGSFPRDHAGVLELPGIGRYTAGAICSIAYNEPSPILDGNVIRVLTRLFAIRGDPRSPRINRRLWSLAESMVESAGKLPLKLGNVLPFVLSGPCSALNQALMELGALVCTPKLPQCRECPLQSNCRALQMNRVETIPKPTAQRKATSRRFITFAIESRGRWLVRQRPTGTFNAHLWEFPAFEIGDEMAKPAAVFRRVFGAVPGELKPLRVIRHSITRYRMTLTPFRADWRRGLRVAGDLQWRSASDVEALALTSAHRKLWRQLSVDSSNACA